MTEGAGALQGPGLLVMGGHSRPKGVGSNPGNGYWMDISSHILLNRIVMFV